MRLPCVAPVRHLARPRTLARGIVTATALCAVGVAAACGGKDPYAPVATFDTVAPAPFVVYPLRMAPPPQGSAIELRTPVVVRPAVVLSATLGELVPNFDVAFDFDSVGRVVLKPPKLVTAAQLIPRTGFQTSTTLFDSLKSAPGGTYQADSAFPVAIGQTVVAQVQGTGCTVAAPFYAKLVIDSVNTTTGAIYLRVRTDPNCGFKSFEAGLPTS